MESVARQIANEKGELLMKCDKNVLAGRGVPLNLPFHILPHGSHPAPDDYVSRLEQTSA
jgi:hypothetical protein